MSIFSFYITVRSVGTEDRSKQMNIDEFSVPYRQERPPIERKSHRIRRMVPWRTESVASYMYCRNLKKKYSLKERNPDDCCRKNRIPVSGARNRVMQYLKISLPYSSDMRNCSNVVPPNSFTLLAFKFLSTIIY